MHDTDQGDSAMRRMPSRPVVRHERYQYTYRLLAGTTPLQFLISWVRPPFRCNDCLIFLSQRRTRERQTHPREMYLPAIVTSQWHRAASQRASCFEVDGRPSTSGICCIVGTLLISLLTHV